MQVSAEKFLQAVPWHDAFLFLFFSRLGFSRAFQLMKASFFFCILFSKNAGKGLVFSRRIIYSTNVIKQKCDT